MDEMRNRADQGELFAEEWRKTFQVIPKLPYSFSYRFTDADGRESTLQILDWEIGALFWKCFYRHDHNEKIALEKVRRKYVDEFFKTDLHLFLRHHQRVPFQRAQSLDYHRRIPNPARSTGRAVLSAEARPKDWASLCELGYFF